AFRASYEPVLDLEAGEVVGVLAIVQDVTLQLVAQGEAADVHARADLSVRLRMQLATTPLEPRQVGTCLGQLLVENGLAQHCTVALLDDETGRFDTLAVISPNEDLQEMVTSWIDSHSFTRATPPADIVVRT